jgi:hypothetical protein
MGTICAVAFLVAMIALSWFCLVQMPSRSTSEYGFMQWRIDGHKKIHERHRAAFGRELNVSGELIGKSKKHVLLDLGTPDRENEDGIVIYVLGPDPGFGIDVWELHVTFDEGGFVRATEVKAY